MKQHRTAIAAALIASMTLAACSEADRQQAKTEGRQATAQASAAVDDAAITTKVKAALAGDPRTNAHQVNVETREGAVQLSGFVDTSEAKSTAEELARNVDNVKSVDNEIDVKK